MSKKRLDGLDIIRTLAIILVFVSHYMSVYVKHYLEEGIGSGRWFLFTGVRYLMILCVPLFLLLTGYLQTYRKPDRHHYSSIIPVMISWLVISFASTFLMRKINGPGNVSTLKAILKIFDFSFGYTWYVEMYLCLFLVLPFINILLDHLTQKQFVGLLITVIALTGLYDLTRSFIVAGSYLTITPFRFVESYCITYYLIGAYIRRYKPKANTLICIAVALSTLALEVFLNYVGGKGAEYAWWMFHSYSNVTHIVVSSCIFMALYRIEDLPRALSFPFREISACSFEMYLISYVTDKFFYDGTIKKLLSGIPGISYLYQNTYWFALILNFIFVYICARILRLVLVPISKKLRSLCEKEKKKPVIQEAT